jgi:metal-sulfur cluster biosynthetic enzyme
VRNRLAGVQGLSDVHVNLVWEPSWGPERLSPAARKALGID